MEKSFFQLSSEEEEDNNENKALFTESYLIPKAYLSLLNTRKKLEEEKPLGSKFTQGRDNENENQKKFNQSKDFISSRHKNIFLQEKMRKKEKDLEKFLGGDDEDDDDDDNDVNRLGDISLSQKEKEEIYKSPKIQKIIKTIISELPLPSQADARNFLYTWIKSSNMPVSFNPNTFELMVNNEILKGTNISDIVRYLYDAGTRYVTEEKKIQTFNDDGSNEYFIGIPKGTNILVKALEKRFNLAPLHQIFEMDETRIGYLYQRPLEIRPRRRRLILFSSSEEDDDDDNNDDNNTRRRRKTGEVNRSEEPQPSTSQQQQNNGHTEENQVGVDHSDHNNVIISDMSTNNRHRSQETINQPLNDPVNQGVQPHELLQPQPEGNRIDQRDLLEEGDLENLFQQIQNMGKRKSESPAAGTPEPKQRIIELPVSPVSSTKKEKKIKKKKKKSNVLLRRSQREKKQVERFQGKGSSLMDFIARI